MARSFGNNPANRLSRASSLISTNSPRPISIAVWLNPASWTVGFWNNIHALFTNNFPTGSPALLFNIRGISGLVYQALFRDPSYLNSSAFTRDVGVWGHHGLSWNTDNSVAFYLDGVANGVGSLTSGNNATNGAAIGVLDGSTAGWDVDGRLAEFGVWNAILTAGEFAALAAGVSPLRIRPGSLVCHVPIWGHASPEIDLVSATTWTVNGTLTQSDHAPTQRPWALVGISVKPAAAGGGLSIPVAMQLRRGQGVS